MSKTAEDVSGTLNSQESSLNATDQIAALLVGDDESTTEEETSEETQTQDSKLETDEESNEESEAEGEADEETTLEAVAEDDEVTWENTLGVDEGQLSFDDDGNIDGVNIKVNGESSTIGMKDLIAGYQNNKVVTTKSQALAEERKGFDDLKGKTEQEYVSKLASVEALTKHFEKQLIVEYDNVDWANLRDTDPAEYAAARHDFQSKAGELQRIQQAIATDTETQNKEQQEGNVKARGEYMKGQFDKMIENNPEWSDETVRKTARAGYQTFVKDNYGFDEKEFDMVFDARLIELIKDAKKYHDGATVAGKKRQNPVPKFQKSRGQGQKPKVSKLEKLTAASKKATGSQRRDLQQSAVAELLIGGA